MRVVLAAIGALLAIRGFSADNVEFAGYMQSREDQSFILCDRSTGQISPWIRLGQPWDGYVISRFDPAADSVTVSRGLIEQVLVLRHSKTGKAPLEIRIVRGSYQSLDGTRIYTADAQIRIGGKLISAPNGGYFVSNERQEIFEGDFAVETPNGITPFKSAVMRLTPNGADVVAKEATFTSPPPAPNPGK